MRISEIVSVATTEGEKLGFDVVTALGHPVAVYGTNGDRLGDVGDLSYEGGEVRLHLAPAYAVPTQAPAAPTVPVDTQS